MLLWYSSVLNPELLAQQGLYNISWVYEWPNKPRYIGVRCLSARAEFLGWNHLPLSDTLSKHISRGVASSGLFPVSDLTEKVGIGRETKQGKIRKCTWRESSKKLNSFYCLYQSIIGYFSPSLQPRSHQMVGPCIVVLGVGVWEGGWWG